MLSSSDLYTPHLTYPPLLLIVLSSSDLYTPLQTYPLLLLIVLSSSDLYAPLQTYPPLLLIARAVGPRGVLRLKQTPTRLQGCCPT